MNSILKNRYARLNHFGNYFTMKLLEEQILSIKSLLIVTLRIQLQILYSFRNDSLRTISKKYGLG
ncbi:hypothetical protein LEP1GSC021_3659 [Leptospira noguchii str. 1993005606]|uniref:Uncharacterized protein n=2 Tax=Leptospira noguchii TaxID=28182 RepID=M6XXV3_9LEPT|nr:hypothetical protein LEP1GSC035_3035 [Leptospira noguchii str. 2007001578]EMO86907.1 hypothetical protein LEP1GSC024_4729 [Leptospira noguchii str. 2001034031]EPE82550.1 hypothetical protein LEP1GSC021_3659 [Leptospira noguchii str. 1993005606]